MIHEITMKNIGPFRDGLTFSLEPTDYEGKSESIYYDFNNKPVCCLFREKV